MIDGQAPVPEILRCSRCSTALRNLVRDARLGCKATGLRASAELSTFSRATVEQKKQPSLLRSKSIPATMSVDYLLHESSVGYAIFQVVHQADTVGNRLKEVQDSVQVLITSARPKAQGYVAC